VSSVSQGAEIPDKGSNAREFVLSGPQGSGSVNTDKGRKARMFSGTQGSGSVKADTGRKARMFSGPQGSGSVKADKGRKARTFSGPQGSGSVSADRAARLGFGECRQGPQGEGWEFGFGCPAPGVTRGTPTDVPRVAPGAGQR
jgi:hypothetical protein